MSDTPNPNVFFRGDDMGIGNFPIKGGKMSNQPINDGGPAFPTMDPNEHYRLMGMTLRDYFAAAALSSRGMYGANIRENAVAKECYIIADAMLKAREGK